MAQLEEKRFFGREWVLSKLWHSLQSETRTGVVIVGGPGAGKTTLCLEIVGNKYKRHVLAHHFCDPTDTRTLSSVEFILGIVHQLRNHRGYQESLQPDALSIDLEQLGREFICRDPDSAFKKLILLPLLQIKKPRENLFLLVDSIDEIRFQTTDPVPKTSKSIGELLSEYCNLLPTWLRLLCTARKQGKLPGPLSAFRKISLDDQRKVQVVRDVQQFILSRLDQDYTLRQHINRETAEMLNQLRIKSNGCFLYLEKVLTGISGNFIVLREIREIPGTLNGLYLWLCQRLFTKKQFSKVRSILSIILASQKPLNRNDIFIVLHSRNVLTNEDFTRRMYILRRLLITVPKDSLALFHYSFAEWLSDVKYCTQRYLCHISEGHSMLAISLASLAPHLDDIAVAELCYHLLHMSKPCISSNLLPLFLLCSGVKLSPNQTIVNQYADSQILSLLDDCKLTTNLSGADENIVLNDVYTGHRRDSDSCLYEGGGEAPCEQMEESELLVSENTDLLEFEPGIRLEGISEKQLITIHEACNEGNLELLRRLISEGADLEAIDRHGRTALNIGARQGHENIVKELISNPNVDLDHADDQGWSPLRSSAWAGHNGVVLQLLQNGAEVDLTDTSGKTALRAASWGGHDDVVASLLKFRACPLKADLEGRTPLIAAAYMGHSEIVSKLLNGGADINHSDSDGRTALSVAALCVAASPSHLDVVRLLLERNAYVNHQDKDGQGSLLIASFEGQREVCELLLEFEADVDLADKSSRSPLWAAASMGHLAVAELLLFWGAYVDHIDAEGRTVLSVAAAQGNVGVVSLLLARGLDEGHRDNSGWTPFHYAAFEGHEDVCEILIEAGARIDDIDNEGKSSLFLASQEGHLNVVIKLINYGCDINLHAHDGRNSLTVAATEGFKDIVQVICSRGGNLNYRDSEGRSTLYLLALESRLGIAQVLIRHGADVETRDFQGRTPLHISAWQGHMEMVELLVSAGADVNATDKDSRSCLQSASWQGHTNIVRFLCRYVEDVDHVCNQGATSLCIASQEGYIECVKVLLEAGADPTRSDFYGRNPKRVALKSGHSEILRLLNEVIARNKSAVPTETSVQDPIQCFDKPGSNSQFNLALNEKLKPLSNQGTASTTQPDFNPTLPAETVCQGSLSFTQQVQQISKQNSRLKSRNLPKSFMNGHESPSYKTRPFDEMLSSRIASSCFSPVLPVQDRFNHDQYLISPTSQTKAIGPTKSKGDNSTHSFAFTRDSHMKIILGSSSEHPPISSRGSNGISSATTVIRSGLIALKAGVMEAAVGRKILHSGTLLVSAASLAVPHINNKSPQTQVSNLDKCSCIIGTNSTFIPSSCVLSSNSFRVSCGLLPKISFTTLLIVLLALEIRDTSGGGPLSSNPR